MDLDLVPADPSATNGEQIEGLDEYSGAGWGSDYPLDSVFVRPANRTLAEVLRRIDANRYVLAPDFQRDFVWPEDKQSKLIESCVMRIPLPVFYFAEADDGRIIVVDGLQRLTTFHRFTKGRFRLRGLTSKEAGAPKHPLEGLRFKDLPINLQERILDTQLITYILDAKAPDRARLDIFERVNSGVPLTRQQMRNALYNGPATMWLRDAAQSPDFIAATGHSLDPKPMRDREAINRFCAFFLLGWETYKSGDMDGFLATALNRLNNSSEAERATLTNLFAASMEANRQLFGAHAFRKSLIHDDPHFPRNILNIALFDVCSVLLARISARIMSDGLFAVQLKQSIISLVSNDDFSRSITYSTNSTQAVSTRFSMATTAISNLTA